MGLTNPEAGTEGRAVRWPELDGLRGLAIAFVLIWHCFVMVGPQTPNSPVGRLLFYGARWTWSGVDLFFVISGFLITGLLMDVKMSARYFGVFYLRRACRILPLYFLLLGTYALASRSIAADPFLEQTGLVDRETPLLPFLLFLQNFWSVKTGLWGPFWLAVTWSLAIEEQFYLLLPLAVRFLSRSVLTLLLVGMSVLAPVFRIGVFDLPQGAFAASMLLVSRLDALCLGGLAAVAFRDARILAGLRAHWRVLYVASAALFAFLLSSALRGDVEVGERSMSRFGYTIFALFYLSVLIIALVRSESLLARVTRLRPLRYLGGISYGVYLIHEIVNHAAHGMVRSSGVAERFLVSAAGIGVTLGFAHLSSRYLERPLVGWGRRQAY